MTDGLITRAELRERYRQAVAQSWSSNATLVLGGLMALAAIVAIDVVAGPKDNVVRLTLWAASATTIWTMYGSVRRSGLYTHQRMRFWDHLVIRLNAVLHFGMFASLSNAVVDNKYWILWSLAIGGHCLLNFVSLHLAVWELGRRPIYAYDARTVLPVLVLSMTRWKWRALGFAVACFVIAAASMMAPAPWSQVTKIATAVLAVAFIFVDMVILSEEDLLMDEIAALIHTSPDRDPSI